MEKQPQTSSVRGHKKIFIYKYEQKCPQGLEIYPNTTDLVLLQRSELLSALKQSTDYGIHHHSVVFSSSLSCYTLGHKKKNTALVTKLGDIPNYAHDKSKAGN